MRERFRGDSCGESQPLILYVVYLQVGAVNVAAFCRKKNKPSIKRAFTMFKRRRTRILLSMTAGQNLQYKRHK